jgi:hypothetical protein
MKQSSHSVVFFFPELTKTRKTGPAHEARYDAFAQNSALCPVLTLGLYLKATHDLRGSTDRVFISWIGKHVAIGKTTIARWLCQVLSASGIDPLFTAHSTRSAATSAAALAGLPASQIMKAANWAPGSHTFLNFYHRQTDQNFTNAVLSGENSNAYFEHASLSVSSEIYNI